MQPSKIAWILVMLASVSGCAGKAEVAGSAGAGGLASDDGSGGRGEVTGPIFTAESTRIDIGWFNYFRGGYRFVREREQLSTEQLALVEAIQVVPHSDECWQDANGMRVIVTTGESESIFDANEFNGDCGTGFTMVDYRAVSAVLATVHCLAAKSYDGQSPAGAPTISAGDGCQHGLFNGGGAKPDWWFRLAIEAPGEYRFSLPQCGDRGLLIELFESDAVAPLASAASASECASLTHSFAEAGTYLVHVKMQSGVYGGDFYLSVDPTAD